MRAALFIITLLLLCGCQSAKRSKLPPVPTLTKNQQASFDRASSVVQPAAVPPALALYWEHDAVGPENSVVEFKVEESADFVTFNQIGSVPAFPAWQTNLSGYTYRYPIGNATKARAYYRVATITGTNHVRLSFNPPQMEFPFPGSEKLIQRVLATRPDGLKAYGYPLKNDQSKWRIALFREPGDMHTLDIDFNWGMGCEMAWAGNKLFVVGGGDPAVGKIAEIDVTDSLVGGSVTMHSFDSPATETPYSIRWPGACAGFPDGRFVGVWDLQVSTGLKTLTAYRNAAGQWSSQVSDLYGSVKSTQPAGRALAVTHPGDGTVWICGIKDSWGVFTAARYSAGANLTFLGYQHVTEADPVDGVVDPCAFDREHPLHFRVIPEGDKLRVLGNAFNYIMCPTPEFLKVTHLVSYTVTANGAKSAAAYSNLWTERVYPDYGIVGGRIYMFSVPPTTTVYPSKYNLPVMQDYNEQPLVAADVWDWLGFGEREIIYPRNGQLWLRKL